MLWKKSLKSRLLVSVVLPMMLALLATGVIGFFCASHEAEEIYDAQLAHIAKVLLAMVAAENAEEGEYHPHDTRHLILDMEKLGHSYEKKIVFRIWRGDSLLFYSSYAEHFGPRRTARGFSEQVIGGRKWRFFVLPDAANGYSVEVAEQMAIRREMVEEILTAIFLPLAALLPLLLVAIWFGLRLSLKPLLQVSQAVRRRSPLDMTPLDATAKPQEIAPLVSSINGLLSKLDYALQKERRFTDFAAHELRTPIAIFKTQAQTALRSEDEEERRMILEAQVTAADRAVAMMDQLLALARLEHAEIPTSDISLSAVARDVAEELMPMAEQKHLVLCCDTSSETHMRGNREMLEVMLRNVIGNAIKYTPEGGEIIIGIDAQRGSSAISVRDSGPGIPEEHLAHVTERFYRATRQKLPGAGLGLTIVKRAAELTGALLIIRNRGDRPAGLEVRLEFAAL